MNLAELRQHKPEILRITEGYGISNVRVFGSVARGEERPESDVDLLIKVTTPQPFGSIAFKLDMEVLLGCPVDVVSEKFVHPRLKEKILSEAVPL